LFSPAETVSIHENSQVEEEEAKKEELPNLKNKVNLFFLEYYCRSASASLRAHWWAKHVKFFFVQVAWLVLPRIALERSIVWHATIGSILF
jgi:hypothetical protein